MGYDSGAISRMKNPTEENIETKKAIIAESDNLKKNIEKCSMIFLSKETIWEKESYNPCKVSTDGRYANLLIDLNKLYGQNKLIARIEQLEKK